MNLVNEISAWETELANLRAEVKLLRDSNMLLASENALYKNRCDMLDAKCEYHMTRHIKLKTLLDRTGADLVQAVQALNDEPRQQIKADAMQEIQQLADNTNSN